MDMLVNLSLLPEAACPKGYSIVRVLPPDRARVLAFVRENFGENWESECGTALAQLPCRCLAAVKDGEIVGSVACPGNKIDDLIVNEKHQHKGYERQLLLWGLNHIRKQNREPVSLHVAEWNQRAVRLYRDVGFEITRIERICPRNTTGGRSD